MTVPTPSIDYVALKAGGIIMQKDDDFFALRLRLPGGSILADKLPKIAEVARKYGPGEVRLTARQGIEIPWIKFSEIELARKELAEKIADFVEEEEGMMIIARCLDFYQQHGNKRERLEEMIHRVGMDEFKAAVLP